MNSECRIKDDDEILEEEKNRFNFRRYTPEEIEKKHSPFERNKKKDISFLFQKKKTHYKEERKISLDELVTSMDKLTTKDLSGNQYVYNGTAYTPTTPPYPPESLEGDEVMKIDLNSNEKMNVDG